MAKKVFVFENDPSILEVVVHILNATGYETMACCTQESAIADIEQFQPHAILLDVVFVTHQGTELCRMLDESPISRHIPIIAFTTNRNAAALKEICADDVVEKPFDIDQLLESIADQISA
ncbi:MAG: response regulator [Mucilaginibacter polytrichastri]|nr:response regulator [Mucilaginibacter polytrichastri]